ncbi:MAG: hypothetical protein AB8G86_30600 [Saprospiraceae bacterium]
MKPINLFLLMFCFTLLACQSSDQKVTEKAAQEQAVIEQPTTPEKQEETFTADDYRNENWRPAAGNYFFSEMWTWEYFNEGLPADNPDHKGKFIVYVDPPTGTMLLADNLDEMTDWIIIHPDGRYTTAFTDVHGKPHIVEQKMADFPDYAFKLSLQKEDFQTYFTKQAQQKEFGHNKYDWPIITADAYQQTFAKTMDTTHLYLKEMPFAVRGLYLVAQTNQDLNFPINLGYGYLLPENYLVISEVYRQNGKEIGYSLASVSPTDYTVNTVTYKLDH